MIKSSLLLLATMILVLSGCDSESGNGPGTSLTTQAPNAGSSYTYHYVSYDSTGTVDFEDTRIDSVAETNISFNGKNRVMRIAHVDEFGFGSGQSYFNFEPNGDISEFIDFGPFTPIQPLWVSYPIQSRTAKTYTILDTTIMRNGVSTKATSIVTISHSGISSMQVGDSTLTLVRIKLHASNSIVSQVENTAYSAAAYYYFAPSIGYIAQIHEDPIHIPDFPAQGGSDQLLVSYRLR
jgi:hypothetical protein